jgi:methyl-accepting chemotaxis protein
VAKGGFVGPIKPGQAFWLRATVSADALNGLAGASSEGSGPDSALYFLSDIAGPAFDAYVNGVYIGSRGRISPTFDVRRALSDTFLIDAARGDAQGKLVLALRCSYMGKSCGLPHYAIGNAAAAARERGAHNFWNGGVYMMLAALCAFMGFYFLALFAFKTDDRENVYFGVSLLLLAFYLYEMSASYLPQATPLLSAFARASLPASILLLYCFFSRFFAFKSRKAFRIVAIALAVAFIALFAAFSGDAGILELLFNVGLLPILFVLVYGLVSAIAAVRKGMREAIPLLVGIGAGAFFAIHDIYYQVLGQPPFAWLQGFTFFFLDAAIFVMLSMRQARLANEIGQLAKKLEAGHAELESSVSRLEGAGNALAAIGGELEAAVASASSSTLRSEGKTSGVKRETEQLALRAREAGALVSSFIDSIGIVNVKLQEEAAGIERTASASVELQSGIESAAANIDKTASFAEGLAALTGEGERAAESLGSTMARIAESAKGIGEVVDSVNEFAERTNLLAMNASIEAAHVGQAGKGFGVIAGEVKKLAAAQGDRAETISALAIDIGTRLKEGGTEASRLGSTLRRIADDASAAALRLSEVKAGAAEQARASAEVRAAMEALAEAVAAIRDEAERQSEYSSKVSASMAAMVTGAEAATSSAADIAREGQEIAREVKNLSELAVRSLALTKELKGGRAAS